MTDAQFADQIYPERDAGTGQLNNWFVSASPTPGGDLSVRGVAKDGLGESEARALFAEWSLTFSTVTLLQGALVIAKKRSSDD